MRAPFPFWEYFVRCLAVRGCVWFCLCVSNCVFCGVWCWFFCVAWVCWVVVFSAVEPFVEQFEMCSPRGPPTVFAFLGHQRCVFCWVVWGVALLCFSCWGVVGVVGLVGLVGWLGCWIWWVQLCDWWGSGVWGLGSVVWGYCSFHNMYLHAPVQLVNIYKGC